MILKDLFNRKKTIVVAVTFILLIGFVFLSAHLYQTWQRNTLRIKIVELTAERELADAGKALPPIAVVMTTYNRVDFLPRAIDSVLNQTKSDFHFIIVDDGSKDDSLWLLYNYMLQDKRIRVYPNAKNKGISVGRNKLLDLSAPYMYQANIDSDDYVFPQWLEEEYRYMQENPHTIVATIQTTTTANPKKLFKRWVQFNKDMVLYFFMKCPMSHSGTMFRRLFLKQHDIKYDNALIAAEDYDLWVKILMAGGRFHIIEKVLMQYRQHADNSWQYYWEMGDAVQSIRNKLQQYFVPEEILSTTAPFCLKLKKMMHTEKGKSVFTEHQWQQAVTKYCPSSDVQVLGYFTNKNRLFPWADYLIKTDNPKIVYRLFDKQKFKIMKQTTDEIVLENAQRKKTVFHYRISHMDWVSK